MQNSQENTYVGVVLMAANFIENRLQDKCFSVNIAKFLRIPTLKSICKRLLLTSLFKISEPFKKMCINLWLTFFSVNFCDSLILLLHRRLYIYNVQKKTNRKVTPYPCIYIHRKPIPLYYGCQTSTLRHPPDQLQIKKAFCLSVASRALSY